MSRLIYLIFKALAEAGVDPAILLGLLIGLGALMLVGIGFLIWSATRALIRDGWRTFVRTYWVILAIAAWFVVVFFLISWRAEEAADWLVRVTFIAGLTLLGYRLGYRLWSRVRSKR